MRIIYSFCLFFLSLYPGFARPDPVNQLQDSIPYKRFTDNLIGLNYRMLPELARYERRYRILADFNDDLQNIETYHSLQNILSGRGYKDSSAVSSFNLLNQTGISFPSDRVGKKELFYGAWRNKLTQSKNGDEIKSSVGEGTLAMIDLGYSDLKNDFLPFITILMEEQHIFNYDNSRTKAFGQGSRGIVTSVQILNALHSRDTEQNFGVCRDVHEMGRELLKTMSETYYNHFNPGNEIDFDDYIFLQSWTTNKSHHVTISLIDPLDDRNIYELDWGRVIEKRNNTGYDNGRLYGNTYRIWQYDKRKQLSVPVDFKRTFFGKILDENILTREEYIRFNGIYDEEFFSDLRYRKDLGKYGGLSFSLGTYNPDQYYFLAGWQFETRKKKFTKFLEHSSLIGVQGVIHEDTRKKQLLYPHVDWRFAASIMGIPRIISKFGTPKFNISKDLTFEAYLNQQFDIFLIGNSFYMNDSLDKNDLSGSGDGNLSFSNGFNLIYRSGKSFFSSLTLQARSCLLPKEIRLFTPNVFTLIPNLRYITPAVDVIGVAGINFNERSRFTAEGMFEFTNLQATIFSGSVSVQTKLQKNLHFSASTGITEQVKGIDYFWYPVSKRWIGLSFRHLAHSLSISFLQYPESRLSCNISFMRIL